jgi:hypothetical protein
MNALLASRVRCALAGTALMIALGATPVLASTPAVTPVASTQQTAATATDIRDIRGPIAIPSFWLWGMALAGAGVLAAGAYASWRFYQRRKAAALLPHEIALARLQASRALMQPDSVRAFSFEVAAIVRDYLEAQFRIMAAHRTTEEFLADLADPRNGALAQQRDLLGAFLQHCDLAKFGGWSLSTQGMEAMHRSASEFVIATSAAAAPTVDIARDVASGMSPASVPANTHKEPYVSLPSA